MGALFHYRWTTEDAGSSLVIVTTLSIFSLEEMISVIDTDTLGSRPSADRLIVVAPTDAVETVTATIRSAISSNSLVRLAKTVPVALIAFDETGKLHVQKVRLQGKTKLSKNDLAAMTEAGVGQLVRARGAFLRAPPGHHFVHPRRRHSSAFFRTANLLIQGEEIGFLSMLLLPYLDVGLQKIWLDSSSIASLLYAACALKSRLQKSSFFPQIESFSSYEHLEKLVVQNAARELVLISATATGSLPQEVLKKTKLPSERVITLFSTAGKTEGLLLFDAQTATADLSSELLDVHDEEKCPWCRDGSRTITFVGDQFLADAATISAYTLVQDDAPKSLKSTMKKYRAKKAFSLLFDNERDVHTLYVNLADTLLAVEHRDDIVRLVRRNAPASTTHILPVGGQESGSLAEIVADEMNNLGLPRPAILDGKDIHNPPGDRRGILVVGASVGSGQAFQDASRDLRDPFISHPRTYFGGLKKHSVADHQTALAKNLEHNNDAPKHIVCTVDEIAFPHPNHFSAWTHELRLWQKVLRDLQEHDPNHATRVTLEERVRELSGDLACDSFFLSNDGSHDLALRKGFAFWDTSYRVEDITHGDVFATIGAILENCRKTRKPKQIAPPLAQSPFHISLLASENFTRFNDGIIQSALLRACFPHELNFARSGAENNSRNIGSLILRMLKHHDQTQGEACLEFLVALASLRLSLAAKDIQRIAAAPREGLPPLISLALEYATGSQLPQSRNTVEEAPPA